MNGFTVLVSQSLQPARPARYRESVSALLATPLLQDGKHVEDRNAQKASVPACSEHVGHFTTRVLYHFHCSESLHASVLEGHEKTCVPFHDEPRKVERIHERVILTRRLRVLLDGGPDIRNEIGRDITDHVRAIPR